MDLPSNSEMDAIAVYNMCSEEGIDHRYRPLIEMAINVYRDVLAESLIAIRLLGSVPRGDAILGQSDIDLMALVDGPASTEMLDALEQRAVQVQKAYPIVPKVELDVHPADELSAFQRFVLSSDSLHLVGTDTLTRPCQSLNRASLAALVTPPAHLLIQSYRAALASLDPLSEPDTIRFYSRLTGKDLLKCLRFHALVRGGAYERSIDRIYAQVASYAPEYQKLASDLFTLYHTPRGDKDAVLAVLMDAEDTMSL